MKNKLLLGAVVVAGLSMGLTSCVDNVESASVTNIRNAKTEQLKSLAALNNANAEAALIIARAEAAAQAANQAYLEAQAALIAAQADYEAAQAELLRAQAAALEAQTEAEKAKLEYELKLLQAELDKKAQELEDAKAEAAAKLALLEKELAALDLALQKAELELKTAQFYYDQMLKQAQEYDDLKAQQAAEEAARKLKLLITEYKTASQNLITAQRQLAKDKMALIKAEAGLEDTKTGLVNQIQSLNDAISGWQLAIAEQQGIIDVYSKYAGKEVTADELYAAHTAYFDAQEAANNAQAEYTASDNDYWAARNLLTNNEQDPSDTNNGSYKYLFNTLRSASYGSYYEYDEVTGRWDNYSFGILWISSSDVTAPANCRGKYCFVVEKYLLHTYNWERIVIEPVFETDDYVTPTPYVEGMVGDNNSKEYYYPYSTYYNLIDDGAGLQTLLEWKLKSLTNQGPSKTVEEWQKQLDEANKALPIAREKVEKAYASLQEAEKDRDLKQEAYDAYQGEEGIINTAYEAWVKADNALQEKEDPTQEEIDAVEDLRETWQQAKDDAEDAKDAYDDACTKVSELGDSWSDAVGEYYEAEWNVVYAQNGLNEAEYGTSNTEAAMADIKALVANTIAKAAENEANLKAYNEACETQAKKALEVQAANYSAGEANSAYWALFNAYYSASKLLGGVAEANQAIANAQSWIRTYEGWIQSNENAISSCEKTLAEIEAGMDVQSEYIEDLKAIIAKDEVAVSTCQTLFDIAKADLEAALNQ